MSYKFNPITSELNIVSSSGGGGSSNSFSVIQPDNGTSPTATTPADVLSLHNSDGNIIITGNSGTDTITFNLASGVGTPGGANESIQFNDGGVFGGFGSWDGTTLTDTGNLHVSGTTTLDDGAITTDGSGNLIVNSLGSVMSAFGIGELGDAQFGTNSVGFSVTPDNDGSSSRLIWSNSGSWQINGDGSFSFGPTSYFSSDGVSGIYSNLPLEASAYEFTENSASFTAYGRSPNQVILSAAFGDVALTVGNYPKAVDINGWQSGTSNPQVYDDGGHWAINGDGSASFQGGTLTFDNNGTYNVTGSGFEIYGYGAGAFFSGGAVTMSGSGDIQANSFTGNGAGLTNLGAPGNPGALLYNNGGVIGADTIATTDGNGTISNLYALSNAFGQWAINSDGSASFAAGNITLDAVGDLTIHGSFSAAAGAYTVDTSGNTVIGGSSTLTVNQYNFPGTASFINASGDDIEINAPVTYVNGSLIVDSGGTTSLDNGLITTDGLGDLITTASVSAANLNITGGGDIIFQSSGGLLLMNFGGIFGGNYPVTGVGPYGLPSDGSGWLANDSITWDTSGNVTLNSITFPNSTVISYGGSNLELNAGSGTVDIGTAGGLSFGGSSTAVIAPDGGGGLNFAGFATNINSAGDITAPGFTVYGTGTPTLTTDGSGGFAFDVSGTPVASISSSGVITGDGSGLTNLPNQTYAGTTTATGTATTTFTVTIGHTMANTNYSAMAEGSNVLSSAVHYVNNKTTTTFDVVYLTGLTGSVVFDWTVTPYN